MSESSGKFRQRPRVAWREIEGEAVLVDPVRGRMVVLNPSGLVLWQALETGQSAEELVGRLLEEFDVSESEARRDVDAFLGSLNERNLLEAAE